MPRRNKGVSEANHPRLSYRLGREMAAILKRLHQIDLTISHKLEAQRHAALGVKRLVAKDRKKAALILKTIPIFEAMLRKELKRGRKAR